jgi:preprotein translocase subunit SecG
MEDKYKFVKSIDLISSNQLVFTARNKYYSDFKNERFVAKLNHVLLKLFFICVLVFSVYLIVRTSVVFILIFTLISVIGLVWLHSYEKYKPVQKEIFLNKDLDYIEFYDDFLNKQQTVYNPKAIKVTVRIDDTYRSYLFVSLSIDIIGSLAQGKELSNIRIVGFRYGTIKNAVSRVNDAALEFKFLADWLELPIITEECVYFYDTNCRHY